MRTIQAKSEFHWHKLRAKPFRLILRNKGLVEVTTSTVDIIEYRINGKAVRILRPSLKGYP